MGEDGAGKETQDLLDLGERGAQRSQWLRDKEERVGRGGQEVVLRVQLMN